MPEIPIGQIAPAAWNPRSHADEAALQGLTESVRSQGVIQPIVVRPLAKRTGNRRYEVVAGSRRLAAAAAADLDQVPAVVRELNDVQAAEVAMAENIQDEAMGPLDEARGYERLLDDAGSVDTLAARIGVPPSRVRRRVRLLDLDEVALEALDVGRISLGHADLLTRVPAAKQLDALQQCYYSLWQDDERVEPAPVTQLQRWIGHNVKLELDDDVVADYFPELLEGAPAPVPTLIQLSDSHHVHSDLGNNKHGLVGRGKWEPIGATSWGGEIPDCEHAQDGVVVHGGPLRILRVCAKPGCPVHRPPRDSSTAATGAADAGGEDGAAATGTDRQAPDPDHEWREREQRRREEAKRWDAEKGDVLRTFAEHVAELKVTPDLVRLLWQGDSGAQACQEIFGDDWTLTEESMGQALALGMVHQDSWSRENFVAAVKPFGFKLPRRKPQRAKKTPTTRRRKKPGGADPAGDKSEAA